MYTIIGSGFGLYGYLPALLEHGERGVVLPLAYRARFESRPELARYGAAIRWVDDHDAALALADGAVIAVSPALQAQAVSRAVARPSVARLLLEKPVAPTPEEALRTLDVAHGRHVRIGFTLLCTDWYRRFRSALADADAERVLVTWHFTAHHFRHRVVTWKRFHSQGGGVLRFYGIHVIALLADAGYVRCDTSRLTLAAADEPERWQATFSGPRLPSCDVDVHGHTTPDRFAIASPPVVSPVVDADDPFAAFAARSDRQDRRVGPVAALIGTFDEPDARWNRLYAQANLLWQAVERVTTRVEHGGVASVPSP